LPVFTHVLDPGAVRTSIFVSFGGWIPQALYIESLADSAVLCREMELSATS
jgi:hypothetical protein